MSPTVSHTTGIDVTLLPLLADGRFHSGQDLARTLNVSRSTINKRMNRLGELGLEFNRVRGRGYRLTRPLDLLRRDAILAELTPAGRRALGAIEILPVVDSTNAYLMRHPHFRGPAFACLAELQTAGRGRRGRSWLAPFAGGLCLSVSWHFDAMPPAFTALGMAMAVAAARALSAGGVVDLRLKWPNDVLWRDRKLGGVLIEMQGEPPGPTRVVAGVGVNVSLPAEAQVRIGRPVADLASALADRPVERNRFAGLLLSRMLEGLAQFGRDGFEPFRSQWEYWDAVTGCSVQVEQAGAVLSGVALGIDRDGALLVESEGRVRRHYSGDVTVRAGAA